MKLINLLKLNILFLFLYFISYNIKLNYFYTIRAIVGILIIALFGINFVFIFQNILGRKFKKWEVAGFSFLSSLTIFPLLVLFEFFIFRKVYSLIPIINFFLILIIILIGELVKKWKIREIDIGFASTFRKNLPFFFAAIIYLFITIILFSTYKFLPDKDPYTWIYRISAQLNSPSFLISQRPLFTTLTSIFIYITGIDIFIYFKYILPFISFLSLFFLWPIAKRYNSKIKQVIVLMSIFTTSNLILYSQMAMPQMIMINLAFVFACFLLISLTTGDNLYFYFAGLLSLFGILYHELFIILFLIWTLIFVFSKRKAIFYDKKNLIFLVILAISNASLLAKKTTFIYKWLFKVIPTILHPKPNLLFPLYYKNMDGVQVGWQTIPGGLKYYLFYTGPFIAVFSTIVLLIILKKKPSIKKFLKDVLIKKETLILICSFFIFFCIAEIIPRFPGIPSLPDRAWVFAAIFFIIFVFIFFEWEEKNNINKLYLYALLVSLFVSVFGAIYINSLKSNLITKAQLNSADWIVSNLPENRIFFSNGQSQIIKYYGKSEIINVNNDFYFDENVIKKILGNGNQNQSPNNESLGFEDYISKLKEKINTYENNYKNAKTLDRKIYIANTLAKENITLSKKFTQSTSISNIFNQKNNNFYIYYSEPSKKNPYLERPYNNSKLNNYSVFVFDKNPEKFKRIYEDNKNNVIIWQIL